MASSLDDSSYRYPAYRRQGTTESQQSHVAKQENELAAYETRINDILKLSCNSSCADCSSPNPDWASLMLEGECLEGLGVVICETCAVHHHYELGDERCFIKYLKYFHEWTHAELDVLEHCGNNLVNAIYEASLDDEEKKKKVEGKAQARFIRHKYQRCRYRDEEFFVRALELVDSKAQKAQAARINNRRSSLGMESAYSSKSSLISVNSSLMSSATNSNGSNYSRRCSDRSADYYGYEASYPTSRRTSVDLIASRKASTGMGSVSSKRVSMELVANHRRASMELIASKRASMGLGASRKTSMDMLGSKKTSMDHLKRSSFAIPYEQSVSGMSYDGTLCSDIDGSDQFSLYSLEDDENFFLECAKRSSDTSLLPSQSEPMVPKEIVPQRSKSDPTLLAKMAAAPQNKLDRRRLSRRSSNDPGVAAPPQRQPRIRPKMMRRMISGPIPEVKEETAAPLRRAVTSEGIAPRSSSPSCSSDEEDSNN